MEIAAAQAEKAQKVIFTKCPYCGEHPTEYYAEEHVLACRMQAKNRMGWNVNRKKSCQKVSRSEHTDEEE